MTIKKIIKLSFIIILFLVILIAMTNSIVLYEIKENNFVQKRIFKLISLQEEMNTLLKNLLKSNSNEKLLEIEKEFKNFELKFEKLRESILKNNELMIDNFLPDITQNKNIKENLTLLYKSEKMIENIFDEAFKIQKNKIDINKKFKLEYPKEKIKRKEIEQKIKEMRSLSLIENFSDVKYYSKEVLYQYRDRQHFNQWIKSVENMQKIYNFNALEEYLQIIKKVGNYAVKIKDIEIREKKLILKISQILRNNKKISLKIERDIEQLLTNFIDKIYIFILVLLVITIVFILILSYKVYKNVGLSVDEIETKIQKGLHEIKKLNKEIIDTQREVVFTMGAIAEQRSKETGNHVKRVAQYSELFAKYYGLPKDECEMLKQASPMHDIGKVAIPDAILNKPGRFNDEERKIMNTHAELGYSMLKHSNKALLKVASIVAYEHHEKWDGSGYPRGLKGKDIHIYGRITAIADVFDALGSDRVYKKAWDDDKIFALLKEEKGKHFDPKLVDIFFSHLDEFLVVREKFKDKFN